MEKASRYGRAFDQWADEYARLEGEHDRMHPDRGQCGGVGGCPMMAWAVDAEHTMMDLLNKWRVGKEPEPHQHRASCHGAIGELLCDEATK